MNNDKSISGCRIVAVNDESGSDPTYWDGGFVYVIDDPKIDVEVMGEVDEEDSEHVEKLMYAVSLRELVLAAKEAGILDKLAKRTRNDLK